MATLELSPQAGGGPGIEPRWTRGAKQAVGTAYSAGSRVWYTISNGVLSEVYYPTIDRPQIRDLQFLITDGETFFHDERRAYDTTIEYFGDRGLGVRIVKADRHGRYRLIKEIIGDPHQSVVLIRVKIDCDRATRDRLHTYVLVAPHLEIGGWGNSGNVARVPGREFLTAHKAGTWMALACDQQFKRRSCGYVGTTDGWQDLRHNFKLDQEFAAVHDGNIALIAELALDKNGEVTVGVGFGHSLNRASTNLFQSLAVPFEQHRARFVDQWTRTSAHFAPLEKYSFDGGALYRRSGELLLAHEDKSFPGAMIASLSIPWGEVKGDEDIGGYHLVWTRDMVNSATGLMAIGHTATPLRALIYLACCQNADGGCPQNFFVTGEPYWTGIQLDEVAFPIMLALRLNRAKALTSFDPYAGVMSAAQYLVRHGPATPQERWEENSGYSPSTLAANIAGLICAATFARERGNETAARYLEDYADFLESHIEAWTVTTQGQLVPGIPRHYIRIKPVDVNDPNPDEDPNNGILQIRNRPPDARAEFPAKDVVDHGFLELVRYGIRKAGDPLMEDSLKVVDAILKVNTPLGPCWRRYNHDGYGQRDDGSAYQGWGIGRAWPLLTGERAHYELAAGRDVKPYIRAIEGFASKTRLLPEQIWDEPDMEEQRMHLAHPTGAAMPLMWAHAEYIKLLRSAADGKVFDLIPEVSSRYLGKARRRAPFEIWKFNRQVRSIPAGGKLRIQADAPFVLHWTADEWSQATDTRSQSSGVGVEYADINVGANQHGPIRFTFFWPDGARWEGHDFTVEVR